MQTKKDKNLNRRYLMKCGAEVEIIEYKNNANVTIQFVGTDIIRHSTMQNIMNGLVAMRKAEEIAPHIARPQKKERPGEKKVQNCGYECTITAYRSAVDLDVQFSDGAKKEHVRWADFQSGRIGHPVYGSKKKEVPIGESVIQHDGIMGRIVNANGANNILVKLKTGDIIKTSYSVFKKGQAPFKITHLGDSFSKKKIIIDEKEKETYLTTEKHTITKYNGINNIEVTIDSKIEKKIYPETKPEDILKTKVGDVEIVFESLPNSFVKSKSRTEKIITTFAEFRKSMVNFHPSEKFVITYSMNNEECVAMLVYHDKTKTGDFLFENGDVYKDIPAKEFFDGRMNRYSLEKTHAPERPFDIMEEKARTALFKRYGLSPCSEEPAKDTISEDKEEPEPDFDE